MNEWKEWCKSEDRRCDVPTEPHATYKNKGWKGYGDWLGTGNIKSGDQEWLSFENARSYMQNLGLKSQKEWKEWCKGDNRPENIPTHPHKIYKNEGWINYGNWLGTGTQSPQLLP